MLVLPAPAKLNLFLHVLGRRSDGYHELQTLFQFIDLCDELSFEGKDAEISLQSDWRGVLEADNLIVRAAHCLRDFTGTQQGAQIYLQKNIPIGAGLGGGSSDAATTLHGLNRLWNLGLSLDELASVAISLGADVPVFVRGRAAWAAGIGEQLTPMAPAELPEHIYLLAVPRVHVSTAKVFQHPALKRDCSPIQNVYAELSAAENVCEPVTRLLYPQVDALLQWMRQFGKPRLTGTGGGVFVPVDAGFALGTIIESCPVAAEFHLVRALNQSPLFEKLYLN